MTRIKFLILSGSGLFVIGLCLLALTGMPVQAQTAPARYTGARECSRCHRELSRLHTDSAHALTLQSDRSAFLGDFTQGDDVRMVQFPDEDAPRPFTADDIAFAVGTGRHVQSYLYEVSRNDYRILPAQWDVTAESWIPLGLAASWDDPAYDWEQNCAFCHTTGLNLERGRWVDDGVQCEACHGPGNDHVDAASRAGRRPNENELAAIRASINSAIDPQTCGQCHSRGVDQAGLPFPTGYYPGGDLSQQFTLVALDRSDHWWATGHARQPNMQYNEWLNSAHAHSLLNLRADGGEVAPECLSCHSTDYIYTQGLIAAVDAGDRLGTAPEMPTLETAQHGVTCISCHNPHSAEGRPANLVAEPYTLCVSCHSNAAIPEGIHHPVQEMYEGLPIIDGIEPVPGVHFTDSDGPTCTTCHAADVPVTDGQRISHTLSPILPGAVLDLEGLKDNCTICHTELVTAEALQAFIDDVQRDTQARIDAARAAVTAETPVWVGQALDFVAGDGSRGIHNYAYADAVLDAVFDELGLFEAAQ
ncbi:MAG: cytochrome c3 family protein [Candidatus Flexifilum sp.]